MTLQGHAVQIEVNMAFLREYLKYLMIWPGKNAEKHHKIRSGVYSVQL